MAFVLIFWGLLIGAGGSSSPQTIVRVPPKLVATTCPPPVYPLWSRQRAEEGKVVLLVKVDEKGRVVEALVDEPCRYPALNRAARDAAYRWVMQPATSNGVRISDSVRIPIVFRLRPQTSPSSK